MNSEPIRYIDRETGKLCEESVMGDGALRFAYESLLGRSLWSILFGGAFVSKLLGSYYDSPRSAKQIAKLTSIPGCRTFEAEYPPEHYKSFNDFFIRRLKPGCRPVPEADDLLLSPGDGRLTVYPQLDPDEPIPVKGAKKSISQLCCCNLCQPYAVALLRLAPVDYHRFHFPCDCTQSDAAAVIAGKYHSVNPIALRRYPEVYVDNTRHITKLESLYFGTIRQIEVGAFGVGSIIQTAQTGSHSKMEEKGCFKFGGSTVILMIPADKCRFDDDLIAASAAGNEVLVRCGSRIATAKK